MFFFKSFNNLKKFLILIVLLIMFLGEVFSSKYGTAVTFERYKHLPFKFQVDFYHGRYEILSCSGVYIVSSNNDFLSPLNKDSFFISELSAFSVKSNTLKILVKDENENYRTIDIRSLSYDEFISDYKIYEGVLPEIEWIQIDDTIIQKMLLNWKIFFWLLTSFLILILFGKSIINGLLENSI